MSRKLSVRLPAPLEARLERVALVAGRSKSSLVRDALTDLLEDLDDLLEDLDDLLVAEAIRRRIATGRERLIPLEALDV